MLAFICLKNAFPNKLKSLFSISDKIDPAITTVRNDLIASSQLTQTYGLSFVVGGTQDILGDFLGMPRPFLFLWDYF